jgi:hypothetical protein
MKINTRSGRRRGVVCTAALLAVLTGACASSEPAGPADPAPTSSVIAQSASTPESLREELVAAIEARDGAALRSMWPAASWDSIGADVLASFSASSDSGACERLSAARAHCFVFQQDMPFVLGLTMELHSAGRWGLASVSLDSTN